MDKKIRCPCCGNLLIFTNDGRVEIDSSVFDSNKKLISQKLSNMGYEFGAQKEMTGGGSN